jgi:hypothetical protein
MSLDSINILHQGIRELIHRFQRHPFDFLYEADLQAILFALLVNQFEDERITMNGGYPGNAGAYNGFIRTVPVKCEYPGSQRFDISIIDPGAIRHFDSKTALDLGWKNDPFWEQGVRAAVEIKYCQLGDKERRRCAEVECDVEKLRDYLSVRGDRPFLGITLVFIQSAGFKASSFCVGSEIFEDPRDGIARYIVTPDWYRMFAVQQDAAPTVS